VGGRPEQARLVRKGRVETTLPALRVAAEEVDRVLKRHDNLLVLLGVARGGDAVLAHHVEFARGAWWCRGRWTGGDQPGQRRSGGASRCRLTQPHASDPRRSANARSSPRAWADRGY